MLGTLFPSNHLGAFRARVMKERSSFFLLPSTVIFSPKQKMTTYPKQNKKSRKLKEKHQSQIFNNVGISFAILLGQSVNLPGENPVFSGKEIVRQTPT